MKFAKADVRAKQLRKQAGAWLKDLRAEAGLSQIELAQRLGFKYYTFISQVENPAWPVVRGGGRQRSGAVRA